MKPTYQTGQSLKDIIKIEFQKSGLDPVYFMRKYCKIQHPAKKTKIPFDLFPFQEDVIHNFLEEPDDVILKSRQLGISTLCAGFSLWNMIFHNDVNILVIATQRDVAKNLITKVHVMHDNLPSWLRQPATETNKLSLRFKNGSQIKAISSKPDTARSEALTYLIIDEAAFIDKVGDIYTAAHSTLSTGGKAIVLSTPNGMNNWFHDVWVGAEEGTNGFNPIKLHWTLHPERDQEWRDEQTRKLGPKKASQECDCDFITSGDTVIPGEILEWYKQTHITEPVERRGFDSNYHIWEYPNSSKTYMVVADVSRGDGQDFSAFHVFDIDTMRQVAEYKGKIDTKDFGNMLVGAGIEWNDALLIIENNNIGWSTIQQVIDREYPNLFYSSPDLQLVEVQRQLTNKYYREDKKLVAGFSTTPKNRPLIISKMYDYVVNKEVTIQSMRTINEMFSFIWHNGRAEAREGKNDDLIMPLGIALWVRDTALRLRHEGILLTHDALNKMSKNIQGLYQSRVAPVDPYQWTPSPDGKMESLNWLLK